jgi:hypothetical protein
MKNILFILIVCAAVSLQSCYKAGEIQVQNNISQVKIIDVEWGDVYIASELLPGESSYKVSVFRYDEKLPASHKITFKMTANSKTIYLETDEEYLLDEDDELVIVLNDETPVSNPNE